jgi:hypothetical protein
LEACEFVKPAGIIPKSTYDSLKNRGKIATIGRGGNGREILIKYESLPPVYKELVKQRFGDPYEYAAKQPIRDLIQPDEKVRQFFENYEGVSLEYEDKQRYTNDAAILTAFHRLLANKKQLKEMLHISIGAFWQKACEIVVDVAQEYPNTLPTSERRLKPRYNDFVKSGFDAATLIDGRKYNTTNNRKVDDEFEWLIMSLFVQRHRPYKNEVHNDYLSFLAGDVIIIDTRKNEPFDPEYYRCYGEMSDTTIWRILTKPVNMATVDKMRLNSLDYSNKHLPYNERFAPIYSLSKLTMDDYEPPFMMPNGKRLSGYVVMDVTSKCIIGKAFSRDKKTNLLIDSLKDMFRLLVANECGIPGEIEFERHLTEPLMEDDGILKAENLFPFVRLCRAANPREKRAEHTFRHYKYTKKKEKGFRGRPFAKDEANRMNENVTATRDFDEIVEVESSYIEKWNNDLHHDQDRYPGMTRWDVFMSNQNPNLATLKRHLIAQYIGEKEATTIRNNKIMRVQYNNYWLPSAEIIKELDSYSVTAYYLRDKNGQIPEVYIYQNGVYKCTAAKGSKYNESQFEATEDDKRIMHEQFAYRSGFDKLVKERAAGLAKVEVIKTDLLTVQEMPSRKELPTFEEPVSPRKVRINYAEQAEKDL